MMKIIQTEKAPQAIGTYSQAVIAGDFMYVSGQIPLHPETMDLVGGSIKIQAEQVFSNIKAIVDHAEIEMSQCVKINISMLDLSGFEVINEVMQAFFSEPYPARACVGVAALPKGSLVEVETIFYIGK